MEATELSKSPAVLRSVTLVNLYKILDQLDVEDDDRVRADLIEAAIDIADSDPVATAEWKAYR